MLKEDYGPLMPNYLAAYGTFCQHASRLETPGGEVMGHVSPCLIPGRLYQMGGYPVLKYAPGIVRGDLFELPWNFDFKIFDVYEDYHPTRPWACRYVRRRIQLISPKSAHGSMCISGRLIEPPSTATATGSRRSGMACRCGGSGPIDCQSLVAGLSAGRTTANQRGSGAAAGNVPS
jgi:gamma-glutamylcyclotransferase (GGCT)/AIG2-like uncharacterized protein YtfP